MSENKPVRLERDGPIARIRFNRPEVLNVLDEAAAVAFRDACRAVAADDTIRCVVLLGEGRAFMAGGDVARFGADPENAATLAAAIITPVHEGLLILRSQPAPILAAVHGPIAGAGVSLALAADLAIAAENARFFFAYSALGATPDGSGSYFLPRLVGLRRAMEIALLNEPINPDRAVELGLVSLVVPVTLLEEEANSVAARLAAGPTKAFGATRALYERSFGATLAQQLEAEKQAFMASAETQDFTEGCAAFLAKRPAVFQGR